MASRFTAAEDRINLAVFNHLSNADAILPGGVVVAVLFDNGYQAALAGFVESSGPSCQARTSDVSSVVQGSTITIASVAYKVTNVQPDGFGVTTLQLELA